MVENQVEHQPETAAEGGHIVPGAQGGIDPAIVDHRETVIRGVGEKRQDVDGVKNTGQMAIGKIFQRRQGTFALAVQAVAVSDQHHVGGAEAVPFPELRHGHPADERFDIGTHAIGLFGAVERRHMIANPSVGIHRASFFICLSRRAVSCSAATGG